ncbi:hypothetical protein CO038_01670 [Candidatus Pacearchaeota archaeon CG_4_9_14_0_2_um_filter_39_13]|nr:hypothetical protein [Candidatus Pacearchaeota archaeon]OIO42465.1 MAG: hypothetical protein AUJ64_04110 [Candidatus Pacearchaeota archaeon CG1_02_39_14]PJC44838.1 MAG: hypothetical protein CO038_01670 [Candidatus Pacearchaeota archaeon CG_4_9_14_0_2_um_filter_39_13]
MKIPIIVIKLLFLGALFIISNHNLHLTDSSERDVFFDYYSNWVGNLFTQGAEVTGYLVKFKWLPNEVNILVNGSHS